MGSLKPRPTFSPHSSRYWTSSRRASVARAHVVVLMGVPTENAIQRFSFECNIVTIGSGGWDVQVALPRMSLDRKSTRLNSSHGYISYAVFCLKKKTSELFIAASPVA